MKIDLPQLHNFNKDKLAPSNEKLASFTVGQLPKNIMKPFMFISTSKLSIYYQKLRDRYEYLRQLEPLTPCDPKCQEGWYWDCETETCKEFDFIPYITNNEIMCLPIVAYDKLEEMPIGNGMHGVSISEGWGYNDYGGNVVEFITKTVNITETCSFGVCTQYKPAGMVNPFKTEEQLVSEHMQDFKNSISLWLADMRLYDWPNAIVDNYDSISFHSNRPMDGSYWYSSDPIKVCYKYSFANLPAKYVGQEHELAISILRSKYGFRI